ncbi:type IX secretion system protein PorD [Marinifilum sp. RC60d5]|uniref:type IX secretion system protein PorD n=1 Tax=Marinifilum sp. RC60d5 TaxID=3458414 RepID=UPI0040375788
MRKLFILLLTCLLSFPSFSQELRCNIQIVSQKIQGTNKQVFRTMQTAVNEFMNSRRWTNHVYSYDERIECTFLFNLTEQISADEFKGSLQVQASRPVFNSSYNTVLLNFKDDDVQFKYVEYQSIDFNETVTPTNLTGLLAFYANLILGLDYDTFAMDGGAPYYSKAEAIVNKMQNSNVTGWKAYESRDNRYWLIENLLNNSYSPVRECLYRYHRLGLDRMSDHLTESRAEIADSMKLLQKAYRAKPGAFILQIFFDAKADEIVNIFTESFNDEKKRVYNILSEIDPANIKKYNKIIGQ